MDVKIWGPHFWRVLTGLAAAYDAALPQLQRRIMTLVASGPGPLAVVARSATSRTLVPRTANLSAALTALRGMRSDLSAVLLLLTDLLPCSHCRGSYGGFLAGTPGARGVAPPPGMVVPQPSNMRDALLATLAADAAALTSSLSSLPQEQQRVLAQAITDATPPMGDAESLPPPSTPTAAPYPSLLEWVHAMHEHVNDKLDGQAMSAWEAKVVSALTPQQRSTFEAIRPLLWSAAQDTLWKAGRPSADVVRRRHALTREEPFTDTDVWIVLAAVSADGSGRPEAKAAWPRWVRALTRLLNAQALFGDRYVGLVKQVTPCGSAEGCNAAVTCTAWSRACTVHHEAPTGGETTIEVTQRRAVGAAAGASTAGRDELLRRIDTLVRAGCGGNTCTRK